MTRKRYTFHHYALCFEDQPAERVRFEADTFGLALLRAHEAHVERNVHVLLMQGPHDTVVWSSDPDRRARM